MEEYKKNELKAEILSFAKEKGFIAGICSAEPFTELTDILIKSSTPFVNYSVKERTDPTAIMPDCKSIIVVGLSYNKRLKLNPKDKLDIMRSNDKRGVFSLSAYGRDYHIVIREFLNSLAERLKNYISFKYEIFVDTGPLVEREILYRAGLAWRGKNFCAVSDTLGSMFNCGYMLTDIPVDLYNHSNPTQNVSILKETKCGKCTLCIDACPGGALNGESFKYEKCVSYLTQKKGTLTRTEEELIGVSLYGCDICQLVCPYNHGREIGEITDIDEVFPRLDSILSMTKQEFKKYKDNAFYWRGLSLLKRNAAIAKKNTDG